jgi:hypothetical protein
VIRRVRSLAHPTAVALTAALIFSLPSWSCRRDASTSSKAREADRYEFAISITGYRGIPFSGSYRVIRSDSTILQPIDGLTPARLRVRGAGVAVQVQKRQAGGALKVRILREGCNPTLGPCVDVDGTPYRTIASSGTVEPYGLVVVSSVASRVPSTTIPQPAPR